MLLYLLTACADPPPPEVHHLTDLYHPILQLNTGAVPGGTEQIQLFVHPELTGKCHPIDALAVTFDGKPMTRLHGRVEGAVPYDRDCSVFEFTMDAKDVAVGPTNTLVVTDGISTWHMALANLFLPRAMTLASTAPVKAGDTVTLQWAPATDQVAPKGAVGLELHAGAKRAVVRRKDITFGAGTMAFQVPDGVSGAVEVSVFGTAAILPAVTTCDGAFQCVVSRSYDVPPVTLNVTPPADPPEGAAAPAVTKPGSTQAAVKAGAAAPAKPAGKAR